MITAPFNPVWIHLTKLTDGSILKTISTDKRFFTVDPTGLIEKYAERGFKISTGMRMNGRQHIPGTYLRKGSIEVFIKYNKEK